METLEIEKEGKPRPHRPPHVGGGSTAVALPEHGRDRPSRLRGVENRRNSVGGVHGRKRPAERVGRRISGDNNIAARRQWRAREENRLREGDAWTTPRFAAMRHRNTTQYGHVKHLDV